MNIFKKLWKTETPTIEEQMEGWSDVECLTNFMKFFSRVGIGTEFIQDEHGFITAQVLHTQCGLNAVTSPPLPLDWPLEPVAFPEDYKKGLN